ncbi:hypothetical protein [Pseudomonas nunensis]|uniref:hypothetical protein n=1 Tax=Pseudomonas nunensis TaxID=2961896 RepID=UPI0025B0AEAA|nr:hypothetical protein [Pseudomonas nunensis]MDN3221900.1 hypothetical protein [Pseudomonas nunensis]
MSLTIKRLKLVAKTADGDYGVDIPFAQGLFILRVENSHGKSTCMNAIAYALGMEKALGLADVKLPFPPSLTKAIENKDKIEQLVISSKVYLEIENSHGEIATLKRQIVGPMEENLIEQSQGGFDEFYSTPAAKLFLHREGDTSRELGFYHWLCKFIGWTLPLVPNQDGKESLLYPSIFFPTWFVEQKKGWSAIQATTPLFLRVKEEKKRAIEFILNLDTNETIKKRASLKVQIDDTLADWKKTFRESELVAARIFGKVTGVSESPDSKFDPYKLDVSVKDGERWNSMTSVAERLEFDLEKFIAAINTNIQTPKLDDELQLKIDQKNNEIRSLIYTATEIEDENSYLTHQINSTQKRINSLVDDKRKYEDLKKIGSLSFLEGSNLLDNECPTCGQEYTDNIIDMARVAPIMSFDESLLFIKEQIKTFESVSKNLKSQLIEKKIELNKISLSIKDTREVLSRLRSSTFDVDYIIREENLRKKINIENEIQKYKDTIAETYKIRLTFDKIFNKYKSLSDIRRKLPAEILSNQDLEKLGELRQSLVSMLVTYGFSSFDANLLEISNENYLPTREGYDIGFDTSASDGIRIIWSYLLSLFKIREKYNTNHPGVLIFDEPRQQEANKLSFTELLKTASALCSHSGQIIFATSEDETVLKEALGSERYTLVSFDKALGKIIRKLD